MSLKRDYRRASCGKVCDGCCGWGEICGNPYHMPKRKMKRLARRRVRRTFKIGDNDDR